MSSGSMKGDRTRPQHLPIAAPSARADLRIIAFSIDDLPPVNTKRWVIRRKAEVVTGVRCGIISLEEACRRYRISVEEFLSWQRLIESHGLAGLRSTRLQEYRSSGGETE